MIPNLSSYAAGIWGQLIRNPSQLFDVVVPPYVEESLGVIAQVFDDCLATQSPKFTEVGKVLRQCTFESEIHTLI